MVGKWVVKKDKATVVHWEAKSAVELVSGKDEKMVE
jgi:hypothetical protein